MFYTFKEYLSIFRRLFNNSNEESCYLIDKPVTKIPIVYIAVPKNASESMKVIFKIPLIEKPVSKKIVYSTIKKHNYAKFIIIRNPFHRAISCFFHLVTLGGTNADKTRQTTWYKAFIENDVQKSFNLYLDFIALNFYDQHTKPQCFFLEKHGLSLSDVEYVLLQERLDKGFSKLCTIIGVEGPFLKYNTSVLATNRKNNYFILHQAVKNNKCVRQKIKNIYNDDFTLYKEASLRAL